MAHDVELDEPCARLEFVDVATGEAVRPAPPERDVSDGSAPTGRIIAELEGVEVEIEEDDIIGRVQGEHPREQRYRFDQQSPVDYRAQARAKAAELDAAAKHRPKKPRGFRATFDSAKQAAREFYDANEAYFDNVPDPFDGLRDWMDGIEVRVGRGTRRLAHTSTGQRILGQRHAIDAIRQSIAYVFGQARGRRWDAVDWRQIDRLDEALRPYFEPGRGPSHPGLYWRPVVGTATLEQLEQLTPAVREQLARWEGAEEVALALADLREAYAENRGCVPPKLRGIVERRIDEWQRWTGDPRRIPAYACEPDERTGGYTCNYPSVAGELRELRQACERGYDPDWAELESRAAAPGFPDTSFGPEDPRVVPITAAELDDEDLDALELEALRQLADDGRAYGGPEPAIRERRELDGVLYQLEFRTCGKRNPGTGRPWCWCFGAFPGGGHGPYWYAYWRDRDGSRRSKYIGKRFRELGP